MLLLKKSGAHLHPDERAAAGLLTRRSPEVWSLADVGMLTMSESEMMHGEWRVSDGVEDGQGDGEGARPHGEGRVSGGVEDGQEDGETLRPSNDII